MSSSVTAALTQCTTILDNTSLAEDNDIEEFPYECMRLVRKIQLQLASFCPKNGYFTGLPIELLEHIFHFVGFNFINISETCTLFRNTCESLAQRQFLAKYGTGKPAGPSWCRCLQVAKDGILTKSYYAQHNILFYGVSNSNIKLDPANIDDHRLCEKLLKNNCKDAFDNLFIPTFVKSLASGRGWLLPQHVLPIMEVHDERNFDAILNAGALKRQFSHTFLETSWILKNLPNFLNNDLLPKLLVWLDKYADELVMRISRQCVTMEHVRLLEMAMSVLVQDFGAQKYQKMCLFWSPTMNHKSNSVNTDAYIQLWMKHHPNLVRLEGFCHIVFSGYGNVLSRRHCLEFLKKYPNLQFGDMPPQGIRTWWQACADPLLSALDTDESVAIEIFDQLFTKGLPLGWCSADKTYGWTLRNCIFQPLMQGYHKKNCKAPQFLAHVISKTIGTVPEQEVCPKNMTAYKVLLSLFH